MAQPPPIFPLDANEQEEFRQLAEVLSDSRYVISLIMVEPGELLPGESIPDLELVWQSSSDSFQTVMNNLLINRDLPANSKHPKQAELITAGLSGNIGKAKKRLISRLKDRFLGWWFSTPRTRKKREKAADAAVDYLEYLSSLLGSIKEVLKEIPGVGAVIESIEELVALLKQLIGLRLKRGH
jgi:hypothetical protein